MQTSNTNSSRTFLQQFWPQRRARSNNSLFMPSDSRLLHIVYSKGKRVYFAFMCTGTLSVILVLAALFFLLLPVQDDVYKKNSRMIHSIHLWEKGHFSEELQKFNFNLAMTKRNNTVQYPFEFNEERSDIHDNPFKVFFTNELRQYPSSYFSSESFSYEALLEPSRMKKILNVTRIESGDAICLSISSTLDKNVSIQGLGSHKNGFSDPQSNLFFNTSNCYLKLEHMKMHIPGISFVPWHHRIADYSNLKKKSFCQTDEECLEFCKQNYVGIPFKNNQFLNLFLASEVCVVVKLDKQEHGLRYVRGCYRNDSLENYVKVTKESMDQKIPLKFRLIIREETDPVLKAISISGSDENEPYITQMSNFQMLSKIFFSVGAFLLIILATVGFYWKVVSKSPSSNDQTRLLHDISVHSRSTAIAIQSPNMSEVQSNSRE